MFKNIDFTPGIITYNETDDPRYLHEEDLFQVSYNNDMYVLDLGWYGTEYAIMVIRLLDWSKPIWERRCKELSDLIPIMNECSFFVRELLNKDV
jgi:hypothetical protein